MLREKPIITRSRLNPKGFTIYLPHGRFNLSNAHNSATLDGAKIEHTLLVPAVAIGEHVTVTNCYLFGGMKPI